MTSTAFATLPEAPYFAVIFSSQRRDADPAYDRMADLMVELASAQPGFLGVESARGTDGFGITVSYWRSPEDIAAWKAHTQHRAAQAAGKTQWYAHFELRVARVERSSGSGSNR
jgi:heme-degrading monooxygenase HmoA